MYIQAYVCDFMLAHEILAKQIDVDQTNYKL